jgi:hypothetical protein
MTNLAVNLAATRPAIRLDDQVLSYTELDAAAHGVAGELRAGPMPLPMLATFRTAPRRGSTDPWRHSGVRLTQRLGDRHAAIQQAARDRPAQSPGVHTASGAGRSVSPGFSDRDLLRRPGHRGRMCRMTPAGPGRCRPAPRQDDPAAAPPERGDGHQHRGCRGPPSQGRGIARVPTPAVLIPDHSRPQNGPLGQRHVRALRPGRLRSQGCLGPGRPRRRSTGILVTREGFSDWRP